MKLKMFKKLNWEEWKFIYLKDCRGIFYLNKIENPIIDITLIDNELLILPKYNGGDWYEGKPTEIKKGEGNYLVRLPAIKLEKGYFILDGVHRLTKLKPKFIVLDYLEVSKKELKHIADFNNKNFNKYL